MLLYHPVPTLTKLYATCHQGRTHLRGSPFTDPFNLGGAVCLLEKRSIRYALKM
jgi:hypothetical protein